MAENKPIGMFMGSYDFLPEKTITQDDLNIVTIEFLRRLFVKKIDGKEEPFPYPDGATTQEQLIKLYATMKISFRPDVFEGFPAVVRKHFMIRERNGAFYRYGHKPRALR